MTLKLLELFYDNGFVLIPAFVCGLAVCGLAVCLCVWPSVSVSG